MAECANINVVVRDEKKDTVKLRYKIRNLSSGDDDKIKVQLTENSLKVSGVISGVEYEDERILGNDVASKCEVKKKKCETDYLKVTLKKRGDFNITKLILRAAQLQEPKGDTD